MATYRYSSIKFPASALAGVDADCVKGLRAFLASREGELNTITTTSSIYSTGPFEGQSVELESSKTLPLNVNGWIGHYEGGIWHGTTGKALTIPAPIGQLAKQKDAGNLGRGFEALADLFGELAEDPEERAFTVVRQVNKSIEQNGQDDFGFALAEPRRAGVWNISMPKQKTFFVKENGKRIKKSVITYDLASHEKSPVSCCFMDDFGDLINAPALCAKQSIKIPMPVKMATYTIGRTRYTIRATAQGVGNLRAKILAKKRFFADKYVRPVDPASMRTGYSIGEINARAAQDVAAMLASAQAAAAIEQAQEAAQVAELGDVQAIATATEQAQEALELETVGEYAGQAGGNSSDTPNTPRGHAGTTQASAAPQSRSTSQGQAIKGKSGNWSASFYTGDDGRACLAFNTTGSQSEPVVFGFEHGRERMRCLQELARIADKTAADLAAASQDTSTQAGYAASQPAGSAPQQPAQVLESKTPQDDSATDESKTPQDAATPGALQITITRAEGPSAECCKPVTVGSFDAANAQLYAWSETAPKNGGYDKCDFSIIWPNGDTYAGRYDLKHHSDEPASLARHMIDEAEFMLGKFCPLHMNQADYDQYLKTCTNDETRAGYALILSTMAEMGVYFEKQRPIAINMQDLTRNGITPADLIGLGVVYIGDRCNPDGEGAIVDVEPSKWRNCGHMLHIITEDGRTHQASLQDFEKSGAHIYRLNMKRHGAPYLAQLAASVAMIKAQASAAKEQEAKAHAKALQDLGTEYANLQRHSSTCSAGKLAAVNMRTLLKQAFPGHKFSVTSSYNSARVCWTDGPTDDQVSAVISQFDIGASDSQSDYFYTVRTAFSELFGGVQYLNTSRHESDELVTRALSDLYPDADTRPSVQDWRKCTGAFIWTNRDGEVRRMRKHINTLSAYQAPAPKATRKASRA